MAEKYIKFEDDEKKSIMVALIVSAVVIIAIVLAYVGVKKYQKSTNQAPVNENVVADTSEDMGSSDGNVVVTNQEELNAALEDSNTISILFQTEEEQSIVVPAQDYSSIDLSIDAPYTDVINNGVFSKITIYRVNSNTWTENAVGNSFLIDSVACHMVVNDGALISSIENMQDGSTLAIESKGDVELLALEADSSIVSVQTDGTLRQLQIYKKTNLNMTGSQTLTTGVEIEYGADGTALNCSVPTGVSSFASATLVFTEGAENSEVAIKNSNATVQVTNGLADALKVTEADGTESMVEGSETVTFAAENSSGEEEQSSSSGTGSTTSSSSFGSGSSGSGSSTSSSGSTGSNRTYVTSGYTKEQVDQMVASAVEAATKEMLDKETANAMVQNAVKEATEKAKQEASEGMITQEKAQELIQEAVKDTITKDKAEEMVQDAVKDMITQEEAQKVVEDAVDLAVTEVLSKPMIVGFTEEPPIYVEADDSGEVGTRILPATENLALPQYVYGHTYVGDIYKIPVIGWQNLDQYSQNASPGAYRFAAILQTIPECNVAGSVRAVVTVYVKPSDNKTVVTYKNKDYEGMITVSEHDVIDSENALIGDKVSYYYITNNSNTEVTYVALDFYYYDDEGKAVEENAGRWYGRYLQPGESCIAYRENPSMDYAGYFVEVDAGKSGMKPAKKYCQSEIYYLDEQGELSETITRHVQMKIYKKETKPEISECNVTFLHIGLNDGGQRVVLGVDTVSTGRKEINSINSTDANTPIVLDITPPESTVETVYAVVGGYAIVEQTEDEDKAGNSEKTEEGQG